MDKIQNYALAVLLFHGCDEYSYGDPPVPVEKIVEDLKKAYPKGMDLGYTHEDVAQAILSISKRTYKTVPQEGFDSEIWGRCGLSDLDPNAETELRHAVSSGKPFNTGWHYFDEADYSLRIVRDDRVTVVECHDEIDELFDLIDDCLFDGEELTDEQYDEVCEACYFDFDFTTELTESIQLPSTASFDNVMAKARELIEDCRKSLDDSYNFCLGTVLQVLYKGDNEKIASLYEERKIKE